MNEDQSWRRAPASKGTGGFGFLLVWFLLIPAVLLVISKM